MTRRTVTLAAVLGLAGTAAIVGGTDVFDRDAGATAAPSISAPAPPPDAGIGAEVKAPPLGDDDGDLNGGTVAVDSDEPAVSRLNPDLLAALRDAASAAGADGVDVRVTSGWRSKDYQQRLLDEAITKYGSREEALRWVATPDASAHTRGAAVDVGFTDAAYWMLEHGAEFGLCQTYANEIWHFELLTSPGGTCPTPRADGNS